MPSTKKKATKKKTVKKTVKKMSKPAVMSAPKKAESFSPEFTNALLTVFAVGMMLFAYVIYILYK